MTVLRRTTTRCPECVRSLEGTLEKRENGVFLTRVCPDHGPTSHKISNHPEAYAELDRFYFEALEGRTPRGRITNYWVLSTPKCQAGCAYCNVGVKRPVFEEMTLDNLDQVIQASRGAKLTLSGGEPTVYPHMLEFFRKTGERGITTELATNGARLAKKEFCESLRDAGVREFRVSVDSFRRSDTEVLGTERFFEPTLKALRNLEELNMVTAISPTLLKGLNEDQLLAAMEFASDRKNVTELSVNGFSWTGDGRSMDRSYTIMPDEMMDILHRDFGNGHRDEFFSFQKLILAALDAADIRLCLYAQIMIFVREHGRLTPLTAFLNMPHIERGMRWWERFSHRSRLVRALALALVALYGTRLRTIRLAPSLLQMVYTNLFVIRKEHYPRNLLPVVLNTNCSSLSADEDVSQRCMSGIYYVRNGELKEGRASSYLLERDEEAARLRSGRQGERSLPPENSSEVSAGPP